MKSLMQVGVFCTQPFRLPYAGRVGICIFDKTGTLTSDALQLQRVVAAADVPVKSKWSESADIDSASAMVLAGCHSLIVVDGKIEGHPEEKAAATRCGVQLRGDKTFDPHRQVNIERLKMFPFNSTLARMSVIAGVSVKRERTTTVLVKGAPETIKPLLAVPPPHYDECYQVRRSFQTPNPKPQTPNPKSQTQNPKPKTQNPKPKTPKPKTQNPKP